MCPTGSYGVSPPPTLSCARPVQTSVVVSYRMVTANTGQRWINTHYYQPGPTLLLPKIQARTVGAPLVSWTSPLTSYLRPGGCGGSPRRESGKLRQSFLRESGTADVADIAANSVIAQHAFTDNTIVEDAIVIATVSESHRLTCLPPGGRWSPWPFKVISGDLGK